MKNNPRAYYVILVKDWVTTVINDHGVVVFANSAEEAVDKFVKNRHPTDLFLQVQVFELENDRIYCSKLVTTRDIKKLEPTY